MRKLYPQAADRGGLLEHLALDVASAIPHRFTARCRIHSKEQAATLTGRACDGGRFNRVDERVDVGLVVFLRQFVARTGHRLCFSQETVNARGS